MELNDEPNPNDYVSGSSQADDVLSAAVFNDAILNLGGRVAERYLSNHHNRNRLFNQIGDALALPPDLELAKKVLVSTMSTLYAMMLIVLCLVFTSTEIIAKKVPMDYFESYGFYTYLYSLSVVFLIYIFGYVVRVNHATKLKERFNQSSTDFDVQSVLERIKKITGSEINHVQMNISNKKNLFVMKSRAEAASAPEMIEAEQTMSPPCVKLMTSENEKSHGSLFLRLGTVAFGLGTLIYTGLEFLAFFETPRTCIRWEILDGINPVLYMIFVFMQMYFIFTHSRININKNKTVAKFGMMHIIATNVCIVIRTLVKESVKEILKFGRVNHPLSRKPESECEKFDIIGDTFEHSSVYLFPFIIEYSIIGCAVIYRMWSHIGKNPTYFVINRNSTNDASDEFQKHKRYPLDWSSSSTGLFMGLLSLVALIISLILYFALVNQEKYKLLAILINSITDTLINGFMILVMIFGFYQVRRLQLVRNEKDYDILSVISAFGIVVYAAFTVIAGVLNDNSFEPGSLVIVNGVVEILEVNIQLLFIADLKQRRVCEKNRDEKPGRQSTTYLLICNLALWITYNFEIQKVNATPDQVEFYGFLPWVVIQRITMPLCVFFRFHSSVILMELWKDCYRLKKDK